MEKNLKKQEAKKAKMLADFGNIEYVGKIPPTWNVWNRMNVHLRPKQASFNDEISMAVPEQTMTMRKMLDRHLNKQSVEGQSGMYEERDPEMGGIHYEKLDLTDIQEIKQNLDLRRDELLQVAKQEREATYAARKEAADKKQKEELEALEKVAQKAFKTRKEESTNIS